MWQRLYVLYGDPWLGASPSTLLPLDSSKDKKEFEWDDWIDGRATQIHYGLDDKVAVLVKDMERKVDSELHKAPEAVLQTEARVQGGTIVAKVQVKSLTPPHSDVYVRMLVVEDTVNLEYTDPSQGHVSRATLAAYYHWVKAGYTVRLNHYMVVRAASRDNRYPAKYPMGELLHGTGTVSYTFDMVKDQRQRLRNRSLVLGELQPQSELDSYHLDSWKTSGSAIFADIKNWKLNPTRLHLVTLVQDAHTGDILQTQMIPVNTGRHGELLKLP